MKWKKKYSFLLLFLICAFVLVCCVISGWREQKENDNTLAVHILDVGQGDCTLIITPDGQSVLIDTGLNSSEQMVRSYLKNHHIRKIDFMILTHLHDDHIGGADMLLQEFEVSYVVACPGDETQPDVLRLNTALKSAMDTRKTQLIKPGIGDKITLGEAIFTFLYVPQADASDNNASLLIRLDYGENAFLFAGDAEEEEEEIFLHSVAGPLLQADFLKISHHGASSSTTPSFLQAVTPKIAVISAGSGNAYGHPHEETLQRLRKAMAEIHRTDREGTLLFRCNGHEIRLVS